MSSACEDLQWAGKGTVVLIGRGPGKSRKRFALPPGGASLADAAGAKAAS